MTHLSVAAVLLLMAAPARAEDEPDAPADRCRDALTRLLLCPNATWESVCDVLAAPRPFAAPPASFAATEDDAALRAAAPALGAARGTDAPLDLAARPQDFYALRSRPRRTRARGSRCSSTSARASATPTPTRRPVGRWSGRTGTCSLRARRYAFWAWVRR
jgi:hypothetical protein